MVNLNIFKFVLILTMIIREFSAFDEIVEGEKYTITLTKEDYSENGIKQINLFDFLMNDNF